MCSVDPFTRHSPLERRSGRRLAQRVARTEECGDIHAIVGGLGGGFHGHRGHLNCLMVVAQLRSMVLIVLVEFAYVKRDRIAPQVAHAPAVVGSIILRTSAMRVAGNPLTSACLRMIASSFAK